MYSFETKIQVRYNETDRMGYLHHSNYASYFEVTRMEMMRNIGISYKELEDSGIIMPVYDLKINFKQPAFYDDFLTIYAEIQSLPIIKLIVDYKIKKPDGLLVCIAKSTNAYVSVKSKKPIRAPEDILEKFKSFF